MAPACPVCSTPHLLKTSAVTGEPLLSECVKALRAELETLRGATPSADGTSGAIGSLNDRLTAVEGLLGQKVCFSTFDELVNRVAALEASVVEAGVAVFAAGSPELPPVRSVQVGDGPVTPVEPSGD